MFSQRWAFFLSFVELFGALFMLHALENQNFTNDA